MSKLRSFSLLTCALFATSSSLFAQEAPKVSKPTKLGSDSINSYIKNFKTKLDTNSGEVKILGLVHPDCKDSIRVVIENLDASRAQDGISVYPVRVILDNASGKCTDELASKCTTESCVAASTIESLLCSEATDGSVEETAAGSLILKKTGKLVLRTEDYNLDPSDPNAILDKSLGSELVFKDTETLNAEAEIIAQRELDEKINAACEKAIEGDLAAIEELQKLGAEKEMIDGLTKQANRIEFEKAVDLVEDRINNAEDTVALEILLDDVQKLSKKAEADDKPLINALIGRLDLRAKEICAEDNIDQHKRFRFEKKLWKFAKKFNPKSERAKLSYSKVALEHARWAAETGDVGYYNGTLADARNAQAEIARLASRQNASEEVLRSADQFRKSFELTQIPFTPFVYHYGFGTSLDKTYAMKLNSILEQDQMSDRLTADLNVQNSLSTRSTRRSVSSDSDSGSSKIHSDDVSFGDIY